MTCRRYVSEMARKENWRQEEISALVKGVDDRIDVIKGKFSPFYTSEKKAPALADVLERYIILFEIFMLKKYHSRS